MNTTYYKIQNQKRLEQIERNVPKELMDKPQWCVFKCFYDAEKAHYGKVILNVSTGRWASSTDSSTWTTFDEALAYAKKNNCAGLSYALSSNDNIYCVDLDNALSTPLAEELLEKSHNTYVEKSVSGKGLHIFFRTTSDMTLYKQHSDTLECYGHSKFISMTGEKMNNALIVDNASYELLATVKQQLGVKAQNVIHAQGVSICSDNEVLCKVKRSRRAADFERLWNGEDICGDHSRSDYMLCRILAYFTDCDAAQIDRLFRQSGLYRPKWDNGYGKHTIAKAIEHTPVSTYRKRQQNYSGSSK